MILLLQFYTLQIFAHSAHELCVTCVISDLAWMLIPPDLRLTSFWYVLESLEWGMWTRVWCLGNSFMVTAALGFTVYYSHQSGFGVSFILYWGRKRGGGGRELYCRICSSGWRKEICYLYIMWHYSLFLYTFLLECSMEIHYRLITTANEHVIN